MEMPCSQTLALTAGISVARLSDCIFVAHCDRSTTAQFLAEAMVCRAFMIDCNACLRLAAGPGAVTRCLCQPCSQHDELGTENKPLFRFLPPYSSDLGRDELMSAVIELKTTNPTSGGRLFAVGLEMRATRCGRVKQL